MCYTKDTTLWKKRWWWLKEETITNKFTYIPGKKAACWRFWAHENLHSESPGIRFVFKCTNHMHQNLIKTLAMIIYTVYCFDVYCLKMMCTVLTVHNIYFIL